MIENKINMKELGYYNVATISPRVKIANPAKNMEEMIRLVKENHSKAQVLVFPELSLTGYTCEDLFLMETTHIETLKSLERLTELNGLDNLLIFGMPIRYKSKLYNVAVVVHKGKIIGMVPKTFLPEYNEFYEKRWFTSGQEFMEEYPNGVIIDNYLLSTNQIFNYGDLNIAIEICEDMWAVKSPSNESAIQGAHLIVNLSASSELIGKSELRKKIASVQSEKTMTAYCYASSGFLESTKDVVFSGHSFMYELGSLVGESKKFEEETVTIYTIDKNKIDNHRIRNKTFGSTKTTKNFTTVEIREISLFDELYLTYNPYPFIPKKENPERAEEIIAIQTTALKRRLMSIGTDTKIILGLSGGLDSTLALLIALRTTSPKNIYAYSLPGPGTSENTKANSKELAMKSGINFKEISIESEVSLHLKNIEHDIINDITYENVQARIRTTLLFNLSNKHGGIVLGTGNLSESALGFCTYSGDHMSNYNINISIPKTLVRYLVEHFYKEINLSKVLKKIVKTKVSPELKKLQKGEVQDTEKILGPYYLHDFFLYHYIRNSFDDKKIEFIANLAFINKKSLISSTLKTFRHRFNKSQFKRTVAPAGVMVGSVSLSPRGSFRMPDEL